MRYHLRAVHSRLSGRNSSVGRALDWRSKGPWFNPGFRHPATATNFSCLVRLELFVFFGLFCSSATIQTHFNWLRGNQVDWICACHCFTHSCCFHLVQSADQRARTSLLRVVLYIYCRFTACNKWPCTSNKTVTILASMLLPIGMLWAHKEW